MKDIFSKRLKTARLIAGFSMEYLANQIGLSKQMISKYERGISLPDSEILIKLSAALNMNVDYFFRSFNVDLGRVEFRKKSSLSKTKQEGIKEKILDLMENYIELEDLLTINYQFKNPLQKTIITTFEEAEQAANKLRDIWKLGLDPIHNVVSILEDNEIKLIETDEDMDAFDGLSTYVGGKFPVIVVNKNFPVERKRFTLLHELAHLLLQIPAECNSKDKENICNRFAGALLLPQEVVEEEFGRKRKKVAINELIAIQSKFGISIKAIVFRLHQADIISESFLKQFYIRLNQKPALRALVDTSRYNGDEASKRFEQLVYRAVAQEMISTSKASAYLHSSVQKVKENFALI